MGSPRGEAARDLSPQARSVKRTALPAHEEPYHAASESGSRRLRMTVKTTARLAQCTLGAFGEQPARMSPVAALRE